MVSVVTPACGQPGALGSGATSSPPGQNPRPRPQPVSQPRGPELSQTPPRIPGSSPGAGGRELLPRPAGGGYHSEAGILPAVPDSAPAGSVGRGTAGRSWELRLQPPTAQTPRPKPRPQHRSQLSRGRARSAPRSLHAPGSWASAVCDPRSQSMKGDPELRSHSPSPILHRVRRALGVNTAVPQSPGTSGGPHGRGGRNNPQATHRWPQQVHLS